MGIYTEALRKAQSEGRFDVKNIQHNEFVENGANTNGVNQNNGLIVAPQIPYEITQNIRQLQERIEYLNPKKLSRTIAICGVNGAEGASTIAYYLAQAYAHSAPPQGNRQVATNGVMNRNRKIHNLLLIDANLHKPSMHNFFGIDVQPGLADIVEDNAELSRCTKWIEQHEFAVVPAGRNTHSITDIFKSKSYSMFLKKARQSFSTIIIDYSAMMEHPDILTTLPLFEGIVLVARHQHTKMDDLRQTKMILEQREGKILGVVLNRKKHLMPKTFR